MVISGTDSQRETEKVKTDRRIILCVRVETDRQTGRQTETDRQRQTETKTDRQRQRETKTDRQREL